MKGLMISRLVTHPYRVMRTFSELDVEVHVLGSKITEGLKYSRYCKSFTKSLFDFDGDFCPEMADEANAVIDRLGIDIVFPSDHASCRSFHGIKDRLRAKSFPGPSLEVFDELNDKSKFTKLCQDLGIPTPATQVFENRQQLFDQIESSGIHLPSIAKPLNLAANRGIVKLSKDNVCDSRSLMTLINYEPIIVQDFIDGEDIGASIYCVEGRITHFIAHALKDGVYSTFGGLGIFESLDKIARKFALDGVYNFDMRLTPDGQVFYLECNPRFFYKMNLSMIAGMNFVEPGINPEVSQSLIVAPDSQTRTSRALPAVAIQPWRLTKHDLAFLRYTFKDPVSYLREVFRIDKDD